MKEFQYLPIEELPKDWQAAYFGELVEFKIGKTPPRKDKRFWTNGKYPWVSISDMLPYGVIYDTAERISEDAHQRIFRGRLVPVGHTLMSFKLTIGRVATLAVPAYHNEAIISFRPKNGIDERYLRFYLSQIEYRNYQDKAIKGNTLNKSKLSRLEIAIPPKLEQEKIAALLSTIQLAIEQQDRLIALTTELKKALMQKLFTEGTRGEKQKETEIGPVPESWEVLPFEQIVTLQRGKDLTRSEFKDGTVPVAGSNGIIGYHNSANVEGPGVTVGRSGSTGKVTYYHEDFWAHNTSLYVKDFHGNNQRFSSYYLDFLDLSRFKSGASVPTLDRNSFRTMPVTVPTFDEQLQISEVLTTIEERNHYAAETRDSLQDLLRTLLHQLMTAQIRVNDLDLSELENEAVKSGLEEVS